MTTKVDCGSSNNTALSDPNGTHKNKIPRSELREVTYVKVLDTTHKELKNAFNKHYMAGGTANASASLLLYYAVESGLKALILSERRIQTPKERKELFNEFRHGTRRLLKEAKVPANIAEYPENIGLSRGETIPAGDVHQAWRYGVSVVAADETKVKAVLEKAARYISEKI